MNYSDLINLKVCPICSKELVMSYNSATCPNTDFNSNALDEYTFRDAMIYLGNEKFAMISVWGLEFYHKKDVMQDYCFSKYTFPILTIPLTTIDAILEQSKDFNHLLQKLVKLSNLHLFT